MPSFGDFPASLCLTALLAPLPLAGATTITVSNTVTVPSVKRFGMNVGWANYFDSGQIQKNLVSRNPGFEGRIARSIIRCASGTANTCVDQNTNSHWPAGFWNDASYEVIVGGAARGRTGTVSSSTASVPGSSGISLQFADSGAPIAANDFIVLRKSENTTPTFGWQPTLTGGATITGEVVDLSPQTQGRQAVRLTALSTGQSAQLAAVFDTSTAGPFVQMSGSHRVSFRAKGAGGNNALTLGLSRGAPANIVYINPTLNLPPVWTTYELNFTAGESGSSRGQVRLTFSAANQSAVLLDDVSLRQIGGDPTNTTAFRDPVVQALQSFNPGILRYWVEDLADSLDNEIAPPLARMRAEYSPQDLDRDDVMYGLHEFLELCDLLHAEPWWIVPTTFSSPEMTNLLEYLGAPSTTPYGARRAARGRSAPWTAAFARMHLEFGNEAWNDFNYSGATLLDPVAYATRGNALFATARTSPYYTPAQYDLVLGGQAALPARNIAIHNASSNHDTIAVAPYFGGYTDSFSTNEELFGPLFAEPEMLSQTGYMRTNYDNMRSSSRPVPLAIYEVNLHTTEASGAPQTALDSFAPSIGAGIAVADHMLMMLRDLSIKDQLLHCLTSYAAARSDGKYVLLWGSVRDMGVTDRKRPQFLTIKLANEALAGDLVQTTQSGDNPTWNQPLVNRIQYSTAHDIQSYGFVNGGSRAVVVFNLHRTDALQVTFAGVNAPRGAVTIRRLSASAITATNENAENATITTQTIDNFDPAQAVTLPPYSMTVFATRASGRHRAVGR